MNAPAEKDFRTLQAHFAMLGHALTSEQRGDQTLYLVSRWGQSHVFSHPHDLRAFLAQIGGAQ